MLELLFSDDALGRMFEVNVFPEERLSVGDTWERAVEMEFPMLGTIELTYENELTRRAVALTFGELNVVRF